MSDPTTPSGFLRRMQRRLAGWRPGIAWQLGVGFIGVAALAAVANFAVQRTISITTTRVEAAPTDLPPPLLRRPPQSDAGPMADGRSALPALERLSAAVQASRLLPAAERHERVRAAAAEVRATLRRLHGHAGRADATLRAGERLIDIEAARDATYAEYSAQLGSMEARMQAPLDQSRRFLNYRLAPQSVVTAEQRIEEIRREASVLRAPGYQPEDLARLASLESQFIDALVSGERRLTRSQGADWYRSVRADADGLASLRERIVALDGERAQVLPLFRVELASVRSQLHAPATVRPAAPPGGVPEELVRRPLVVTPPWESAPAVSTREEKIDEGIEPRSLAWLSAAVLALLLGVCVVTVLSILRPVQRLIAATQRVAAGETGVRVPPCGSRELDRLAGAFNRMAGELESAQATARNYRQQLEARVAERTRQLQHLADHDALTQLPNRRQLFSHLRDVLVRVKRDGGAAGLFFVDLDNFKNINDGRGHRFGDRVLVAIAERLAAMTGSRGLTARFGGDEFTVVVQAADMPTLEEFGRALVRGFQQPLRLDGRDLLVSISVGAAFHPAHAGDAESLLRAADAALFRAKEQGRGQLALYTPDLLEQASERFSTEQGLRRAVERGEFELVFQPEVDLQRREVTVCEALLRWRRADGRLCAPDEFLAVAEESGLIVEINDWVLRSAIATASRWHKARRELRVAVNASSRQLADPAFTGQVSALLSEHELPPGALEIELTETVLQTGAATIEGLRRLQQMGVAVALDDFGTGYSSLASLEQLPLDRVKLDRSLIAGIDGSGRAASIANAIINLCRDLGVAVTAEGVERAAQLAMLHDKGITLQGYLFSRPVAENQLFVIVDQIPLLLQALLTQDPERADVVPLQEMTARRRRASAGVAEG
jgi:diguanylate cyclase (GGDEF)-like protein